MTYLVYYDDILSLLLGDKEIYEYKQKKEHKAKVNEIERHPQYNMLEECFAVCFIIVDCLLLIRKLLNISKRRRSIKQKLMRSKFTRSIICWRNVLLHNKLIYAPCSLAYMHQFSHQQKTFHKHISLKKGKQ